MGTFYNKYLQTTNQIEFRIKKVIKREEDKIHVKAKGYHNSFNSCIDKKDIKLCKTSYFPEPYSQIKNEMKVILDLSNYATKSDKKRATGVNTSKSAKNVDLACLKSNVEKLKTVLVIYLFIPFLKLTKKHTVFLQ